MAQHAAYNPSPVVVVDARPCRRRSADRTDAALPPEDLLHVFAAEAVLVP